MNILTFDIEEWFHILDNSSTKSAKEWSNYESRIEQNMHRIFSFLSKNKLSATFFVVGWIAEKYPSIIKQIDNYGYEIGSHTHMHQLLYNQNYSDVEIDLQKSINILENITGKKVRYFRAPGFSLTEKNKWVFEILINNGIEIDSSIFPAGRAHGGFPSFSNSTPAKIKLNGLSIKEFPINTTSLFAIKWIFSGGGYFRISPYYLIKKWTKKSDYVMTYFHPRDFDYGQPIIKELSILRKFKSYVGISNCMNKLEKWVNDYDFIDLKQADTKINWDKINEIML